MIYFEVFIIALIALFALNCLYKRTNAYRNQFVDIDKFKKVSGIEDHSLDIVVLGSNAPKFAFDFSEIKECVGMNWAIGPETFEYDFIVLKKFACKLKHDAIVVWPVCPGNFFLDKYKSKFAFVKYYGFLHRGEFPDYNKWHYITEYMFPLVFHPKRVKRLLKDTKSDNRLDFDFNPMDIKEIEKDASWWIHCCWNPEFNINIENMAPLSDANKKAVKYNISVLKETIKFCEQNNLHIIFVYLPLTKQLGGYFSFDYVERQMTQYVKKAIGDNNITLVDYMRDERFQDTAYYINSFFMNRIGARKFTKIFIEENVNKVRKND